MKIFLLLLLILPLTAQELKLFTQPALNVTTVTEEGSFYQLEIQKGEKWVTLGDPIIGTGKDVTSTHNLPADSKIRRTELHKQWVPVWSDEFNGTTLDRSKWAHEVNSYGGGNNERQYYSDAPKYTVVADGRLNLKPYRDPFDQPFHLILNLAADGGFLKDPRNGNVDQNSDNIPDSAFPQVFEIDFVRVLQWAE